MILRHVGTNIILSRMDPGELKYRLFPSYRLWMCLLSFFAVVFIQALYASSNFAWVCMVNSTNFGTVRDNHYEGDLHWGKDEQRHVFAAYSFGGILSLIFGGLMIDRLGAKTIFAGSIALGAGATSVIPLLAPFNFLYVVFLRILVGMGGALTLPLIFNICSQWSAKTEMGIMFCFVSSGIQMGQFCVMMLSGVLCKHFGWPYLFYGLGVSCMIFVGLWLLLYSNDPERCERMSIDECSYLMLNRTRVVLSISKTPWKSIFTSLPVWSCMIANFAYLYIFFIVGQFSPTYFAEVLHLKLESNGFMSALPFIVQLLGRWGIGPLSDVILRFVQPTFSLKLFNSIGMAGIAICMMGLTFLKTTSPSYASVILLCSILFFSSFAAGGFQKSPLHIAPQHTGIIGGLTNIAGMVGTVVLPYVVSQLTSGRTAAEWHQVFYTGSTICTISGLFFLVFGSGELEKWAEENKPLSIGKSSAAVLLGVSDDD